MTIPELNLLALLPEIVLVMAAMLVLMVDLGLRGSAQSAAGKPVLAWLSLAAVVLALAALLLLPPARPAFQSMALADGLASALGAVILLAAGLSILLSMGKVAEFSRWPGAYYALVLLATAGMRVMVVGNDFMTIFLGLEIFSLALYVLSGFIRRDPRSGEAALKYFLLGAFATGFMLYGIALVYAARGTTDLAELARGILPLSAPLPGAPLLPIGVGMLLVGFAFKLALVPFHMGTPDIYQGAPTPVTAFMSVATKAAAFGALIRVLAALTSFDRPWLLALAGVSLVTMTLGNLSALRQASMKRMLAYSSIAHAGYALTGLAAGNQQGTQGTVYYLLGYAFMNLGAFAVLLAVQRPGENDVCDDDMVGLAARRPGLAALMSLFLLSLTGIPPLVGFFGKLYVFAGAVQGGLAWLAIAGVINSAIAAYYYLRVMVAMYMQAPVPAGHPASIPGAPGRTTQLPPAPVQPPAARLGLPAGSVLAIAGIATIGLGVWQAPWMQSIAQAVASLAMR